jgi:hypothetical protein
MTTHILRNALIFLPSSHKREANRPLEAANTSNETQLPRWERHPRHRSEHETGSMDLEWIRTHLP